MTAVMGGAPPVDEMSVFERLVFENRIDEFLGALAEDELEALRYDWRMWAHPNQQVPTGMGVNNRVWMIRAGRGAGKTRAGAETTRRMIERFPRVALIGPTAADVRDVMIEGESGLMTVFPPGQRPMYEPSRRRVTFHNGAIATTFSAQEPERLRGPQHHWAWGDEPASWTYGDRAVENLLFGLRLGDWPWLMLTGTPKPVSWLRKLTRRFDTVVTTGSTYGNAPNLARGFVTDILDRFEGTRLGLQEIYAEELEGSENALWTEQMLDETRFAGFNMDDPWKSLGQELAGWVRPVRERRPWRTIVAVDPPGSTAECGIVAGSAPVSARREDHAVILEDASTAGTPEQWAAKVVETFQRWNASKVVVEANQGQQMTRAVIHNVDPTVPVSLIQASESKEARAEPVSVLYTRGRVHHIGFFPMLESQQITWEPGGTSPDRMDALVHCVASLLPAGRSGKARAASAAVTR